MLTWILFCLLRVRFSTAQPQSSEGRFQRSMGKGSIINHTYDAPSPPICNSQRCNFLPKGMQLKRALADTASGGQIKASFFFSPLRCLYIRLEVTTFSYCAPTTCIHNGDVGSTFCSRCTNYNSTLNVTTTKKKHNQTRQPSVSAMEAALIVETNRTKW